MTQPTSLVNAPDYGARYPSPTPVTQTEERRGVYGPPPPLLSISHTPEGNFCTLSKALLAQLPHLKAGRRFHLAVPHKRGGEWFLDTNPKTGVGVEMPHTPRPSTYLRIPPVAVKHFMRSGQAVGQERAGRGANVLVPLLRFALGEEVAGEPGHFRLIRQA